MVLWKITRLKNSRRQYENLTYYAVVNDNPFYGFVLWIPPKQRVGVYHQPTFHTAYR